MDKNAPIQYQRGWIEFYKLKFKVTPDVLIPRPETELLVDEVLAFIKSFPTPPTIIDVGTGSGNIAISLAKNLASHLKGASANIFATDISAKALKIARLNAKYNKVQDKIQFLKADLLPKFPCLAGRRVKHPNLVIVTNPPYIPSARIPYLGCSVKDFEPHLALDGGVDGFDLYRKLFHQLTHFPFTHRRCKRLLLIGEIDYTHGELAAGEALKYFPDAQVEVKTDLAYKQRILTIFKGLLTR